MADNQTNSAHTLNKEIEDLRASVAQKHKEIYNMNKQIAELNRKRQAICVQSHRNSWESRREPGPYGERYFFCTECNCEA